MAKSKSTIRVGVNRKTGKVVITKKGRGAVDKALKLFGK
jgi:hypothetical protein